MKGVIEGSEIMETKAELLKYCFQRIQILELRLKIDPDNAALIDMLETEKLLIDTIKSADYSQLPPKQ